MNKKYFLSLLLSLSSVINFSTFIFLPKFVGIDKLDSFYEDNLFPSALNLLLSPVLPIVVKNRGKYLSEFFLILIVYYFIFCLNNFYTGVGNLLWVLFGFLNLTIFFNKNEFKYVLNTIMNSILFFVLIILYNDFIISFFVAGLTSCVGIILFNYKLYYGVLKKMRIPKGKNISFFLMPFFSLTSFWLIFLIYIKNFQRESLVLFNYYQKISISITVSLYSYFALDALKTFKLEIIKYFKFLLVLVTSIFSCSLIINNFISEIFLNGYLLSLIGVLSVLPIISFNLVANNLKFRFFWTLILIVFLISLFLGYNAQNLLVLATISFSILSFLTLKNSEIK